MRVVNPEQSRQDVLRALKAALDTNEVPAVLLADIVDESDYDLHTVRERLEEVHRESDGPIQIGRSGGVSLYWVTDDLDEALETNGVTVEELAERVGNLERQLTES